MEKSNRIKMVKGSFEWSDLGSFESLFDYFKGKSSYVQGTNLIIAEDYVEVFGVEQMLIVQHKGALLIMPIAESQEVKNIYNKLNRNNSNLL
jgi:mannose-1-phosphate guanylyltransferase